MRWCVLYPEGAIMSLQLIKGQEDVTQIAAASNLPTNEKNTSFMAWYADLTNDNGNIHPAWSDFSITFPVSKLIFLVTYPVGGGSASLEYGNNLCVLKKVSSASAGTVEYTIDFPIPFYQAELDYRLSTGVTAKLTAVQCVNARP